MITAMGKRLQAYCENCGYQKRINLGSSIGSFGKYFAIPALYKETSEMIEVNYI